MKFNSGNLTVMLSLIGAAALIYLAPLVVAAVRRHHRLRLVAILDIFLGWTVIGWLVALAIAWTARREPEDEMAEPASEPETKVCPACAESVKAAARICRYCRYEFEPVLNLTRPAPAELRTLTARDPIRAFRRHH